MTLHKTCPPDIRTNRDVNQLLAVWSFCPLYTQYGPRGPTPEQKMFRVQTEAMLFRPGTVPVPVLVLWLLPTLRPSQLTWPMSLPVVCYRQHPPLPSGKLPMMENEAK